MKILKLGTKESNHVFDDLKTRRFRVLKEFGPQADAMISEYYRDREKALLKWAHEFDEVELAESELWVDEKAIKNSHKKLPSEIREAIEHAITRIETFQGELRLTSFQTQEEQGVFWGMEVRPLDSVGIYVPGGRANYFTTLLLAAIPARTAKVKEIIVATPPKRKLGAPYVDPTLLYAAKLLQISKILVSGGVGGLAALAFGTQKSLPVQKIVGSGSKRTSVAKMHLSGVVGIDGLTGPSETAFLCDKASSVAAIAADIIGRADRDPEAELFVFHSNDNWVERLVEEIAKQIELIRDNGSRSTIQNCLEKNTFCFIGKSLDHIIEACNSIAPGVVCLHVEDAQSIMSKIESCGILLLGQYTPPVSLDLVGGASGLVPTLGSATYSISMSPAHFMRRFPVVEFDQSALERFKQESVEIAEEEGFSTHEGSYRTRLEKK